MTRWKHEPTVAIRTMYEHNQFSRWHGHVLRAAELLGLLVGYSVSRCWSDGSAVRTWYVMAAQLEAAGGIGAVNELAAKKADAEWEAHRSEAF